MFQKRKILFGFQRMSAKCNHSWIIFIFIWIFLKTAQRQSFKKRSKIYERKAEKLVCQGTKKENQQGKYDTDIGSHQKLYGTYTKGP